MIKLNDYDSRLGHHFEFDGFDGGEFFRIILDIIKSKLGGTIIDKINGPYSDIADIEINGIKIRLINDDGNSIVGVDNKQDVDGIVKQIAVDIANYLENYKTRY